MSSVLLGSSNPSQLTENLGAIQVTHTRLTLNGEFSQTAFLRILLFAPQVIPKMTAGIASEVDHILENRPHSKKDYQH